MSIKNDSPQTSYFLKCIFKRRNELVAAGAKGFTSQELYEFIQSIDHLLEVANIEHQDSIGHYYECDERRLITRISKYKNNHFLWAKDFSIAPTNNLAERSLRDQKVKPKVSGQFQSVETAGFFADIITYTESCYRNSIDTFVAPRQTDQRKSFYPKRSFRRSINFAFLTCKSHGIRRGSFFYSSFNCE